MMWTIKNKKKHPSQRHICAYDELDDGWVFSGKKIFLQGYKSNRKFYLGENGNDIYYRGEKHY